MAKRYKIMKRNRIVLFILILIATSITLCAESKEQFINVGNIKIIKPQLITINREDITININKNSEFEVESKYWFKNTDNINLRTTYLFSVDQYASTTPQRYLKKQNLLIITNRLNHHEQLLILKMIQV